MCGRFTRELDARALARRLDVLLGGGVRLESSLESLPPSFNVAPSQITALVVPGELVPARWGFERPGPRDDTPRPINARAERIHASPIFRDALARGRCVVPASSFYEWQHVPGASRKQPWRVLRVDDEPLLLGGLCATGPAGRTFAIITVDANELMAPLHERMPMILTPDQARRWLDPSTAPDDARTLAQPAPPGVLRAYRVGSRVGSPGVDEPALIRQADLPPEEPGLFAP